MRNPLHWRPPLYSVFSVVPQTSREEQTQAVLSEIHSRTHRAFIAMQIVRAQTYKWISISLPSRIFSLHFGEQSDAYKSRAGVWSHGNPSTVRPLFCATDRKATVCFLTFKLGKHAVHAWCGHSSNLSPMTPKELHPQAVLVGIFGEWAIKYNNLEQWLTLHLGHEVTATPRSNIQWMQCLLHNCENTPEMLVIKEETQATAIGRERGGGVELTSGF